MSPSQDPVEIRHRAEALAAALPTLLVAAEHVATSVAQGVHGRRRVGQGETFWQFRRYAPTDAAQQIDWRQSAKTQHLFVRETEWEAAQSIWLWRDASPSMDYRSDRNLPTKRARADLLLLALAALLIRSGERVALLGSGQAPSSGQATLERIADSITRPRASGTSRRHHAAASLPAFEPLPRHASLVLIGDFLSPLEKIDARVRRFGAHGVVGHLVQIVDPAEEALPFRGRTRFEGLEGEGDVLIRRAEAARGEYRERVADHREGLKALARADRWSFARHGTDHPPQAALLALYMALSEPAAVAPRLAARFV